MPVLCGKHPVKIDDRDYRCSFALVSKVRNYGGNLEIALTGYGSYIGHPTKKCELNLT